MAEYSLADSFGQRKVQQVRIKVPDHEDLVPDAPTDAVGRYVVVLRQWEDLTRRQAKYDEELRALTAKGDALQTEWDTLATERQQCLDALGTLDTPPQEVIERAWDIFKSHLWMHCQIETRRSQSVPYPIATLAAPLIRNPRLTQ